jgi:4,5-dihydroxyphthalate decarboxylase
MAKLELSAALSVNERTRPLLDGAVSAEAIDWQVTGVHPSEMFWRQLKFAEFDVSEMSVSSLMIATSNGPTEWVGLPIFTERGFSHTMIHVRAGAGIDKPADLIGKKVGVPEYQQTSAVWGRGILQHEFGVDLRKIDWYMERPPEKSHGGSTGFKPPEGIRLQYIPPTTDIGEMMMKGELDATLLYITARNLVDRSKAEVGDRSGIRPLFPDREGEGRRFYQKTNILPLNHCVVVRRSVYEQHPWVVLNVYNAFVKAKEYALERATAVLGPYFTTGMLDGQTRSGLRGDPFPYGIKASRPTLEMLAQILHEQGLASRLVKVEEIFAKQTHDL